MDFFCVVDDSSSLIHCLHMQRSLMWFYKRFNTRNFIELIESNRIESKQSMVIWLSVSGKRKQNVQSTEIDKWFLSNRAKVMTNVNQSATNWLVCLFALKPTHNAQCAHISWHWPSKAQCSFTWLHFWANSSNNSFLLLAPKNNANEYIQIYVQKLI